ncbi:hypothetical protein HPB50_027605 [Hyalomma asiaticum]|nr:hypothetical protein HPB50_027605 [Hyalomma asiaticum]
MASASTPPGLEESRSDSRQGKRAMVQSQREIVLAFMEQYPELAQKASELQHGLTLAYRRRLWQLTD